jgi:hypothetical protein
MKIWPLARDSEAPESQISIKTSMKDARDADVTLTLTFAMISVSKKSRRVAVLKSARVVACNFFHEHS